VSKTRALAVLGALSILLPSPGIAAGEPSAAATGDPPVLFDFTLRKAGDDLPGRVDRLDGQLPKLGVQAILAQANRPATPGCRPDMPETPVRSYCFNPGDTDTTAWYPQGVSTVADAQEDQRWGDKQALLVSWYDHADDGVEKGVRVSFLDPDTNRYQHVLLVYPFDGAEGPSYEAVTTPQKGDGHSVHAGGLVWYGNYLYVPDTTRGIRVFDMRKIMDLKSAGDRGDTTDQSRVGRHGDKYYGFGYRYVMPQVATWEHPGGLAEFPGKYGCNASGEQKFSSLSLDRSANPDRLVSSEYCSRTGDPNRNGRVALWPMNGETGQPQTDAAGYWSATDAYRLPKPNVQGATATDGRWYLSSTGTAGPRLQAAKAPGGSVGVLQADGPDREVAEGVEDLSYWPGRDELWTVTETAKKRYLYALPRNRG
jgi:hypothetical protein